MPYTNLTTQKQRDLSEFHFTYKEDKKIYSIIKQDEHTFENIGEECRKPEPKQNACDSSLVFSNVPSVL